MRIFIIALFFITCLSSLWSQSITINTTLGTASYSVSDISKMSFNNDSLFIYLNSSSIVSYPLATVKNHTFSSNSASVTNINSSDLFKIYPNPTSSYITIEYSLKESKSLCLEFFDQSGRLLFKSPYSKFSEGSVETQMDLTSITKSYKGLLHVKVLSSDGAELFREKITIF
jgi:hypothetical protein